uniref:Uncharacterized protein n=1 Tax=Panthera leo TaxID=9689 RepID=A0A8C8WHD7_PANLE
MHKVCPRCTGGSQSIGRAVAQLMAQKLAKATGPGDLGGDLLVFSYDAAKKHEVQNTFEEMEKNLDRVYFLVNAARMNRIAF